jgi:E3 ubiquitin-protein ligase MYCBP2
VLDSARVGGGDEEQKGGRASPASTSRSSRGSSSAAAAGGSAAAPSGSPSLGARPSPSPPPAGSPRLRASPAADAASAPAPAPRRGGVSPVNVLLYAAEDATHLPLHCGFGDTWLTDEAGNAMHPFAGAARVGVVMVAGPYPTADEKSKDTGQGHHTGEWGRFLLVLSASGVLEGYTRIQAFPKPGPQFRYQLGDGSCLVLTCGPWSLELVDGRNRLSYYVKMHTTEGLQDWKELFLRAKQRQLAAPPVAGNVLECGACGRVQPISCFYLCDVQDGVKTAPTCLTCLKARVREAIDAATTAPTDVASDRAQEVLARYSLQDLKDLGSHEQFGEFLDSCTQSYINRRAQKNQFVRCPKCQVAFEVDLHTWATKQSNLTKDAGLDNRPLSKEAQEHFVKNRFRCTSDACGANFCKSCNAQPYHLGFTCEEYKEYKVSPKCRFCHVAVMKRHQIKVVLAETLKEVCDSEECRAKAELSCRARLPCGHPCGGIINEKEHLPCLFPECITAAADAAKAAAAAAKAKRDAAVKADEKRDGAVVEAERQEIEALERKAQRLSQLPPRDDNCSICFESELGTAPSIMLSCGHVLHYTCARQRLEKRWPGVRISWKFAQCALCNVWVDHPSLADLLSPLERMREKLLDKMENRLEIDADEDEDYKERVLNAESAFYKQPIAWAMKTYAFYECHECKQPYFGGKRNCEDNAAEEKNNAEELICHECSKIMSANGCQKPDHQEYLLFKCRFCCSPAVWFCFGNTHFCEYCHSHWPPNRHPANEKCPNNEGKCPLGLPVGSHKNGADADCEFVIGCGMCRNQVKESALNVEVAREKKEVDRSKYRAERIAMFGEPKFPVAAPPPAPAPAPGNVPPAPPVPGGVPDRVDGLRRIVERARNRLTAQEVNQLMEIIRVDFNELQRKLERDLGEDGQAGDAAAAAAAAAGSDSGESDDEAKAAQARPAAAAAPPPPPVLQVAPAPAANAEPEGWNCGACTFLNHAELNECEVCGTAAPADKKRVFREQPQQPLPPGVPPAPPVPQGDFVVLLRKEARRRMRRQKGALRQVMEDLLKEVRRQNVNPAFDAEAPVQVLMRLAAERDEAADPVQRRMLNQAAPADVRGLKSCADAVRAKVCTFAVTRRNYQAQWIYRCHTCNLVGNYGVCESCKDACHKGHRLSKREFAQAFYCDCGPGEVKPNLCKCMP